MKLKRILYCILSLVVVLSFLPGCDLIRKEPKKPKKPKKEWPCDVVPQEPPTEYGNFIAFKLNGIPFAYANCPKGKIGQGILNFDAFAKNEGGRFHFCVPYDYVPLCNDYKVTIAIVFEIKEDCKTINSFPIEHLGIGIQEKPISDKIFKSRSYYLKEEFPNGIQVIYYDQNTGVCRGFFNGYLVSEKYITDPNNPKEIIWIPYDTIRLTDGVISIMHPANY